VNVECGSQTAGEYAINPEGYGGAIDMRRKKQGFHDPGGMSCVPSIDDLRRQIASAASRRLSLDTERS